MLVSEAASRLGNALLDSLVNSHQVRIARHSRDTVELNDCEVVDMDPMDPAAAWRAVRGMEAVVLTGQPPQPIPTTSIEGAHARLDHATRGTHTLLQAAVDAGVRRVVLCSTLELFRDLPDDIYVVEHRRPQPGTDTELLACHLAEQVTREFARAHAVTVTVLRLGRLVREEDAAGQAPDLMWLDPRDAASAVELALGRDQCEALNWVSRWQMRHVCHLPPHPKFLIDGMQSLGFVPEHNFESQWLGAAASESQAAG
jgi:nucleoside-diphosphate-sugar epimerase